MILGDIVGIVRANNSLPTVTGALCVVVDRHEVQRGRWDGRKAVDLSVFVGRIGVHIFWPGLGASFVAKAAG